MSWEATKLVFIIHWLLVCNLEDIVALVLMNFLATSGACATIASDALMNPFDGMDNPLNCFQNILISPSH